jgi:hypothetical protein
VKIFLTDKHEICCCQRGLILQENFVVNIPVERWCSCYGRSFASDGLASRNCSYIQRPSCICVAAYLHAFVLLLFQEEVMVFIKQDNYLEGFTIYSKTIKKYLVETNSNFKESYSINKLISSLTLKSSSRANEKLLMKLS